MLLIQARLRHLHLHIQRKIDFFATLSIFFGFLILFQPSESLLLLIKVLSWKRLTILGLLSLLPLLLVHLDDLGNSVLVLSVLGLLDLLLQQSLTVGSCSLELDLSVLSLELSLGFSECIVLAVVLLARVDACLHLLG